MRNKSLLLIFLLALGLRLVGLGEYPPGPTNDEVAYFYNAYSIAETGRNVFGQPFPLFTQLLAILMPVSTYLIVPFEKILGLSLFSARLPFSILGGFTLVPVYFLVETLVKNKRLALLSTLALAVSPWHIHESRIGYEAIPSLFFYLLAILLTLRTKKNKSILLSFPFFLLAAFSYRAHFIFFPLIIFCLFWYLYPSLKDRKREVALYFMGALAVVFLFWLGVSSLGGNYAGEILFTKDKVQGIAQEVDNNRYYSTAPEVLNKIFINKATLILRQVRDSYLGAFSTNFLFTGGEGNGVRSPWFRGSLYTVEILFVILGVFYLLKQKERRGVILIFLFLLIGPLPSALSGQTYGMRSIFILPFLMVLVAGGWLFLLERFNFRRIIFAFLFLIYTLSISSYLFQYFFRYPIYASERWFVGIRDAFSYVARNTTKDSPVLVSSDEDYDLLQYAFLNKTKPIVIQKVFKDKFAGEAILGNMHFVKNCREIDFSKIKRGAILMLSEKCIKPEGKAVYEVKERGSIRTVWWVYRI